MRTGLVLFVAALASCACASFSVILDTDTAMLAPFGQDIDDDLALIWLTGARARLLGLSTAFGNDLQALTHADALQTLGLIGVDKQPAKAHKGSTYLHPQRESDASRWIRDELRSSEGNVTVVCIGSMANLATALGQEPGLASRIGHLVLLGGNTDPNVTLVRAVESGANFYFSLDSFRSLLALTRDVPTTALPVQLLVQVAITQPIAQRLVNCSECVVGGVKRVHDRILAWQQSRVEKMRTLYSYLPGFQGGGFFPWDVHCAALVTHPHLYGGFQRYNVTVDASDRVVFLPDPSSNIRVPTTVDGDAFVDTFAAMLARV